MLAIIYQCFFILHDCPFNTEYSTQKPNENQLNYKNDTNYRSSRRRCSVKKGVFKNFVNFTGKHLKTPVLKTPEVYNFIKKETSTQVFSYEIFEIFKNLFWGTSANDCFWKCIHIRKHISQVSLLISVNISLSISCFSDWNLSGYPKKEFAVFLIWVNHS